MSSFFRKGLSVMNLIFQPEVVQTIFFFSSSRFFMNFVVCMRVRNVVYYMNASYTRVRLVLFLFVWYVIVALLWCLPFFTLLEFVLFWIFLRSFERAIISDDSAALKGIKGSGFNFSYSKQHCIQIQTIWMSPDTPDKSGEICFGLVMLVTVSAKLCGTS